MEVTIIGVECATVAKNVGIALASMHERETSLIDVARGSGDASAADKIVQWMHGRERVLIALDAPLGWPIALASHLHQHVAGSSADYPCDDLFRRRTDHYVEEKTNKRPLEDGADRIARTAVAALALLADLRERFDQPIPLAWSSEDLPLISAIEVYPAATLRSRCLPSEGYKGRKKENVGARQELYTMVEKEFSSSLPPHRITGNDDVLDAVICALAGIDFIGGKAFEPLDLDTAKREGWIWFSEPRAKGHQPNLLGNR